MAAHETPNGGSAPFDIGRLLQPANAFTYPMAVVDDRDLTLTEKRAILASWASDAADATPVGRDVVMDALRVLDRRCGDLRAVPRYRRILERRVPGVFGRADNAGKPGPALI